MEKAPHHQIARRAALLLAAACAALAAAPTRAASISVTWDSSTGDWFDPTQWTPTIVPNNTATNTYLPSIPAGTVTLSANATISAFSLASSGSLIFDPNNVLSVVGSGGPGSSIAGGVFLDLGTDLIFKSTSYTLTNTAITGPGAVQSVGTVLDYFGAASVSNMVMDATSTLVAGSNSSSLLITGSLVANGGSFQGGSVTVGTGALLNLSTGFHTNTTVLTNNGTVLATTVTGTPMTLAHITNNGLFTMSRPLGSAGLGITSGAIINSTAGTLALVNTLLEPTQITNSGFINLTASNIQLNSGSTTVLGGSVTLDGQSEISALIPLTLANGALISGAGLLVANSPLGLFGTASVQNLWADGVNGTSPQSAAVLHLAGNATIEGLTQYCSILVDSGGTLVSASDSIGAQAMLTNNGVMLVPTGGTGIQLLPSNLGLVNNGAMVLDSTIVGSPGTLTNTGLITNSSVPVSTAAIEVPFSSSGTVTGNFTITANSTFTGMLSPDSPAIVPGKPDNLFLQFPAVFTFNDGLTITSSNTANANATVVTGSLTINGVVHADHLVLNGPQGVASILDSGTLVLSGPNAWITGNASGSGEIRILPAGSLILGPSGSSGSLALSGLTINNQGLVTPYSTSPGFPPAAMNFLSGVQFHNSGTLNLFGGTVGAHGGSQFPGGSLFNNNGLIIAGQATLATNPLIAVPFINAGTVTFSSSHGQLLFVGGGTMGGLFTASSTSTVNFGTTLNIQNDFLTNLPLPLVMNATLSGAGVYTGQINLAGVSTVDNGNFTTIGGSGSLNITQSLTLVSGPQSTLQTSVTNATITILPGATLEFIGGGVVGAVGLVGTTIINQGTATIPSLLTSGPSVLSFNHNSLFLNQGVFVDPAANLEPLTPIAFTGDGSSGNAFINTGTLALSAVSTTAPGSFFRVPFFNTGTFAETVPTEGSVAINFASGGSASGMFTFVPGPSDLAGIIEFSAPYTLSNASLVPVLTSSPFNPAAGFFEATAPLTILGNVSASNLIISAGLNGPGTLTGSANSWMSGTLSGMTLLVSGTLTNGIAQVGFSPLSAQFLILSGGTKSLDGSSIIFSSDTFNTWTYPVNTGPTPNDQIVFRDGATIINHGTFYSLLNQSVISNGDNNPNNEIYNDGTFGRAVGALITPNTSPITTINVPFHNAGLIDIQQGFIDFAGGYFQENNTAGQPGRIQFASGAGLYFSGGSYSFPSPFDFANATLKGTGTIHADILTSGTISPGNSPGILTIDGDLTMNPGASYTAEIAGNTPALFDQLLITGNASLSAGSLAITLLNGFVPAPSDSFDILSSADLLSPFAAFPAGSRITSNNGSFLVTYSPTDVVLSDYQPAPVPEPASLAFLSLAVPLLIHRKRSSYTRKHA